MAAAALRAFYEATEGAHWTNKSGWLGGGNPCAPWFGLKCAKDGTTVTAIVMNSGRRVGVGNSIGGTLPTELGGLHSLISLRFDDEHFSGSVPSELMQLTALTALELSNPIDREGVVTAPPLPLSGTLPSQLFTTLKRLKVLNLENSRLSGTFPGALANLDGLMGLSLSSIRAFSGTLPAQLGDLKKLMSIDYTVTSISGTIPPQLSKLTEDFSAMLLSSTRVSGTVPTQVAASPLLGLNFDGSFLSGVLPTELAARLSCGSTSLSGTLPAQLMTPSSTTDSLGMFNTSLSGTLPAMASNVSRLTVIQLAATSLSGTLPVQLTMMDKLAEVHVSTTYLSGTVPPNLSHIGNMQLDRTSLSGVIPVQLADFSRHLSSINLTSTLVSGSIPSNLASLVSMRAMQLGTTAISGTIPVQLGAASQLAQLNLDWTSVSGTLPSVLGSFPKLLHLGLYDMRLSGSVPASVLHRCQPFGDAQCDGLPPFSCAAFVRNQSRLSLTSLSECVHCPSRTITVVKVALAALLIPLAVALYIWAVMRFPHFKSWIATSSLILSHLQVVGLLSSLTAMQGAPQGALKTVEAALIFSIDLGTVSPQCLLEPQPEQHYRWVTTYNSPATTKMTTTTYVVFDVHAFLSSPAIIGAVTAIALPTIALLIISLAKLAIKRRKPHPASPLSAAMHRQEDAAAEAAGETSPASPNGAMAAQSPRGSVSGGGGLRGSIRASLSLLLNGEGETRPVDVWENAAVIIFTLQLPTAFRVGLRTVVLGAFGDTHYALYVGVPVVALELAYALRLLRHMRALQGRRGCLGWQHTPLPAERLRVRLQYLVGRYARHAPYWQFVLWGRQLGVIAITAGFEAYDDDSMVLAEAGATLAVLAAALLLHLRVRPYAHRYQNFGEVVLSLFSMVAIVVASAVYWRRAELTQVSTQVFGAALIGMLLGPVAIFCVWLGVAPSHGDRQELNAALLQINADGRGAPLRQQQQLQQQQLQQQQLQQQQQPQPPLQESSPLGLRQRGEMLQPWDSLSASPVESASVSDAGNVSEGEAQRPSPSPDEEGALSARGGASSPDRDVVSRSCSSVPRCAAEEMIGGGEE